MEKLVGEGVNSFKFFLAYRGNMAVSDEKLINGLRRSKELGALPMVLFHYNNMQGTCLIHSTALSYVI